MNRPRSDTEQVKAPVLISSGIAPENTFTFTFSHLADAFIQSDLQMRTMEAGPLLANGCLKQDCIVVPPPSNIMEVKK